MGGAPATIADATLLPYDDNSFDAIATSPCYGNRMADSFTDHQPQKNYRRNTYTHAIGRKLHLRNTGQMQWGERYRFMHIRAWQECRRVLKRGGVFVLNISDHIRNKERQYVSSWHISFFLRHDFVIDDMYSVRTKRNKYGENRDARVRHEYLIKFILKE
jgi:DNA modification methylase